MKNNLKTTQEIKISIDIKQLPWKTNDTLFKLLQNEALKNNRWKSEKKALSKALVKAGGVPCLKASEMFLQLQHHHLLANIRARDGGGRCSDPHDGVSPGTRTLTKYRNLQLE